MHAVLSCAASQVTLCVSHTRTHARTYLNKGGTVMQTQTWTLEFLSLEHEGMTVGLNTMENKFTVQW